MVLSLTEEQAAIVSLPAGAWLVVAPPGCGKTEVLVRRVEAVLTGSARPRSKVLVLTFTRRAAENVVARVQARLPQHVQRIHAQRFHEFCHELLRLQAPDRLRTVYERREDRLEALRLALEAEGLTYPEHALRKLLERIELAKKTLAFEDPSSVQRMDEDFKFACVAYAQQLGRMGACDFDDLILDALELLRGGDWPRDLYRQLYSTLLVDEAQDLNPSQYALLRTLIGGNLQDVMLLGDERQGIFGFNGADIRLLDAFAAEFHAGRRVLHQSFRCGRRIVAAANSIARRLQRKKAEALSEEDGFAEGQVRVVTAMSEEDEAAQIAGLLGNLLQEGLPASACHADEDRSVMAESIAVLGRTRFALEHVEGAVRSAIGAVVTSYGQEDAIASTLGRTALAVLRGLAHPRDVVVHGYLARAVGRQMVASIDEGVAALELAADPDVSALGTLVRTQKSTDSLVGDVLSFLEERVQTAEGTDSNQVELLASDVAWLDRVRTRCRRDLGREPSALELTRMLAMEASRPIEGPGARILTVHAAKGQEFRVVVLVGMNEGSFPDYRADTEEQIDEERRLAYVAFTRASRVLILSRPQTRVTRYGNRRSLEPSTFLADLPTEIVSRG